jgi:hypothetical protein
MCYNVALLIEQFESSTDLAAAVPPLVQVCEPSDLHSGKSEVMHALNRPIASAVPHPQKPRNHRTRQIFLRLTTRLLMSYLVMPCF